MLELQLAASPGQLLGISPQVSRAQQGRHRLQRQRLLVLLAELLPQGKVVHDENSGCWCWVKQVVVTRQKVQELLLSET